MIQANVAIFLAANISHSKQPCDDYMGRVPRKQDADQIANQGVTRDEKVSILK